METRLLGMGLGHKCLRYGGQQLVISVQSLYSNSLDGIGQIPQMYRLNNTVHHPNLRNELLLVISLLRTVAPRGDFILSLVPPNSVRNDHQLGRMIVAWMHSIQPQEESSYRKVPPHLIC